MHIIFKGDRFAFLIVKVKNFVLNNEGNKIITNKVILKQWNWFNISNFNPHIVIAVKGLNNNNGNIKKNI